MMLLKKYRYWSLALAGRLYRSYLCCQSQYETIIIPGNSTWRTINHYYRCRKLSRFSRWYPGSGNDGSFWKQATRMGEIPLWIGNKVDFSQQPIRFGLMKKLIEADSVIICIGASAKWLGIPSEERLNGFGVSALVCDGFSFAVKKWPSLGGWYCRRRSHVPV